MNEQEFAQKIKLKHPEYQGMDDSDLTSKVLAKYPEYKNVVQQTGMLARGGRWLAREGLPMAGMAAGEALGGAGGLALGELGGGAVGLATGGIPGAIGMGAAGGATGAGVGSVGGGSVGYAGTKALERQIEELIGTQPKTPFKSKMKGVPGDLKTGAEYSVAGKLMGPVFNKIGEGFPKIAEMMTGVPKNEWAQHSKDLTATLPKFMGGSAVPKETGAMLEKTIGKASLRPGEEATEENITKAATRAKWDKMATPAEKKKLVLKVEETLKNPAAGVRVPTPILIKARRAINDIVGPLFKQGNEAVAKQWMETKNLIRDEIMNREEGDEVAKAFSDHSRARMAEKLKGVIPDSQYLARRGALGLIRGAGTFVGATSPRVYSAAQMVGEATPRSIKAAPIVEILKKIRKAQSENTGPQ